MNKLKEKLLQKKKELEDKINKNKGDIKVLNDNLSFLKENSDIFSWAGMLVPFLSIVKFVPMSLFFQPIVVIGGLGGLYFASKKIKNKLQNKSRLKKIVNNYNLSVSGISKVKCEKELEIEKNKNFQKVISNVCDDIKNGKETNNKEEYSKDDLLNDKKDIDILTTQKFLKENYNDVKDASPEKVKIFSKTSFVAITAGLVSAFCCPSWVALSCLSLHYVLESLLLKSERDLFRKVELLDMNSELDKNFLSMDELSNCDTSHLENKLNKKINRVSDAIYVNSKDKDIRESKEKAVVNEKTNEKEMDYSLFFENSHTKEKPKTYILRK